MKPKPTDCVSSFLSTLWLWLPASILLFLTTASAELTRQESLDAAVEKEDWATAAELATRWHLKEPGKADLLGTLALARIRMDDIERGEKVLEEWEASLQKPSALAHELRGDLDYREKRYSEAIIHWTKSYGIAPSLGVAEKLSEKEIWPEEEMNRRNEWFLTLAKRHPIPKLQWEATQLSLEGRDWDSLLRYRNLLRTVSDRNEFHQALKMSESIDYLWRQRSNLATLDQDLADRPSPMAAIRRAIFFHDLKLHQLALADALFAREHAPNAMAPRIVLGEIYRALEKYDSARELKALIKQTSNFTTLIRLDYLAGQAVISPETYEARARELSSMGQPYLALEDLERCESTPYNIHTKGLALSYMGKTTEAAASFREILQLQPTDQEALAALAEIEVTRANYQAAIPLYQQLLSLASDSKYYQEQLKLCTLRLR